MRYCLWEKEAEGRGEVERGEKSQLVGFKEVSCLRSVKWPTYEKLIRGFSGAETERRGILRFSVGRALTDVKRHLRCKDINKEDD